MHIRASLLDDIATAASVIVQGQSERNIIGTEDVEDQIVKKQWNLCLQTETNEAETFQQLCHSDVRGFLAQHNMEVHCTTAADGWGNYYYLVRVIQ